MKKFTFIIVLVLAIALPGCGGGGNGKQKGQLEGKIYDQTTGDLITSEVTVTLGGKTIVVTDGKYQFTGLTAGEKELTAQAGGYKDYTASVTIKSGKNTHDIHMEEEGQGQDPSPSLEGKIYDQTTGDLITSEVTVTLGGKTIVVTDGKYQFTGLTAGEKELTAQAGGYKDYTASVTIKSGKNTHDIHMEEEGQGQDPSPSLGGKIYNQRTGKSITSEVTVTLDGQTITTTNGMYWFTGLTAGEKELTARAEKYKDYTESVILKSGENTHHIYMEPNLSWGLVAHYTFDGDAQDSSGNGNHGTVHGATLDEDRFGVGDKAYYFDGRDDYIEVERHSFIKPERQEISVAAWLKLSENTGTTKVVYAHDFHITQSGERIGLAISTPQTNTTYKDISYNEWLHFVGIYDGNEIRVYINGAENPESVEHQGSIYDPEPGINLNFGRSFVSTEEDYWVGIIDDFRIYDRVLTDEEINELAGDKP